MRSPVRHLSPGILVPPAKCVMRSLSDIRHIRGLPLPQIPVQILWRPADFKRPSGFVFPEDDFNRLQFSNTTGTDHFNRESKTGVTALPGTYLHDLFCGCDGIANDSAFVHSQRQRFFTVHVHSRATGIDQHFCVPVIGGTYQHHVNLFCCQQFPVIFKDGCSTAERSSGLLTDMTVHITDCCQFAVSDCFLSDYRALISEPDGSDCRSFNFPA